MVLFFEMVPSVFSMIRSICSMHYFFLWWETTISIIPRITAAEKAECRNP